MQLRQIYIHAYLYFELISVSQVVTLFTPHSNSIYMPE